MSNVSSQLTEGFKLVYLGAFFALLAGFFHPMISGDLYNDWLWGVIVLIVGLVGGVLLYKSITEEKRRLIYFCGGFGIIFLSLTLIFQITGRV